MGFSAQLAQMRSSLVLASGGWNLKQSSVAISGFNAGGVLDTVEVYDPSTNTWSTAAAGMPTARKGLAAADANGLIYAVGGANSGGQILNATEQYSPPVTIYTFVKN